MADSTDTNTDDLRQKGPLHRPAANVDAGKPEHGDGGSIVTPPSNSHITRPGIDAPIPTGQTTKM